jgi:CheY-like chemotaxis protein
LDNIGQDRLSIMVVEDNEYMLDILVNSLKRLGFTRVHKFKNGKEAVEYLRMTGKGLAGGAVEPIDIVISDFIMSPVSGVHLLQWLRDDKGSPSRFMPFIMLSGAADRVNVEASRDHGVNDFMAKPFSVENIYKVLQRIIDAPRQFVTTQTYFGPDRRRSKAGPPKLERRKPDESHATIVYSKDKVEKPAAPSDVWLFKLPNYLKQKMGSNAQRQPFVLPDEVLAHAEQQLKREAEGFLDWAKAYLERLSRQVQEARTLPADQRNTNFEDINIVAHELRGQGGTFGYPLITVFAKSLYEVTKPPCRQDDSNLEIVKAHIDTMRAVLRDKIEGDGGELGQALFKALKMAINKYAPQPAAQ